MNNNTETEKQTGEGNAPSVIVRFGVEWSNNGEQWLAIVNDKSLDECRAHFNANTANYKRMVKHEIIRTLL